MLVLYPRIMRHGMRGSLFALPAFRILTIVASQAACLSPRIFRGHVLPRHGWAELLNIFARLAADTGERDVVDILSLQEDAASALGTDAQRLLSFPCCQHRLQEQAVWHFLLADPIAHYLWCIFKWRSHTQARFARDAACVESLPLPLVLLVVLLPPLHFATGIASDHTVYVLPFEMMGLT